VCAKKTGAVVLKRVPLDPPSE